MPPTDKPIQQRALYYQLRALPLRSRLPALLKVLGHQLVVLSLIWGLLHVVHSLMR